MESTEARVLRVIAEQLGMNIEQITPASTLIDLAVDSMDEVEIVLALEDEFEFEITDSEAEDVSSVQHYIDLAKAKRGEH